MAKAKNKISKKQRGSVNDRIIMLLLPLIILTSALFIASAVSVVTDLPKHLNFPIITAIFSLCAFLSAFLIANKKREKGLITGTIYNLPSTAFILAVSLIINGFSADLNLLLSLVTMLISSALGGVMGVNRKQKAKRGIR